jgi:hypothetical protein
MWILINMNVDQENLVLVEGTADTATSPKFVSYSCLRSIRYGSLYD